ncbi:MAG: ImmA/IrrE family metallo-endopeptidase [Magnetococcales bacterium]|nr:ImmA/IrrE family metallo-endopeptidase [Magnetococcales bacterium]
MFDFTFERLDHGIGEAIPMFSGHGRLTLSVHGRRIWCDDRGEEVTGIAEYWDSLVDHLARNWIYIGIEDSYPMHFNPESPLGFLEKAMEKLREKELSKKAFVEEEIKIFAFSDRHNLAAGMPDLFLPPLFILREGNDMRVVTESDDVRLPFEDVRKKLEALGSAIAAAVHPKSERGKMILDAWNQRNRPLPVSEALAMLIGGPSSLIEEIAANDDLSKVFDYTDITTPSPMVLAARMTQHCLEPHEIRAIMDRMARVSLGRVTPAFTEFCGKAQQELQKLAGERHYQQGYELAKWLRSTLNVPTDQTVDPRQWLQDWGIKVEFSKELPDEIDAVARWDKSQACVVVNHRGDKPAEKRRERASLAHEIAHLLADTNHALPAVEILGGRMPVMVEKRAKAFAAELLLPRTQVEQLLPKILSSDAVTSAMNDLTERFNVSRTLTGHQMENWLKDAGNLTFRIKDWIDKAVNQGGRESASSWMNRL